MDRSSNVRLEMEQVKRFQVVSVPTTAPNSSSLSANIPTSLRRHHKEERYTVKRRSDVIDKTDQSLGRFIELQLITPSS
ncbi:hypothetical protein O9929_13905 [Vibrio lentus]|nr:hypothetical protein [Vibrio lentus]